MSGRERIDRVISGSRRSGGRLYRSVRRLTPGHGALTLLFAILLAVGAAALSSPVEVVLASSSEVLFESVSAHEDASGFYRSGLDVSIDVVNPGEAFSGWVEIEGDRRRVLRAVEVPGGATTLRFSTQRVDYRGFLHLRLLEEGEAPLTPWSDATIEPRTEVLVLGPGSGDIADFLARTLGWLKVDQASDAPLSAAGLEAYDFLVYSSPSGEQVGAGDDALRSWVSGGGRLIVAASAGLPAVATEALPGVRFGDQRTLDAPTRLSVGGGGTAPYFPAPSVVAAQTVVTPIEADAAPYSAVLEDGTAVLVSAPFGRGTVTLLGLPLAGVIVDDTGAPVPFFWESAVFGDPFVPVSMGEPSVDPPHAFITGRVPSVAWTVVGAVLYTLGVGVGLFVMLRRIGRRDAVWWVVPSVVLAATLVVLAAGLWTRGWDQEVLTRRIVSIDAATGLRTEGVEVGFYAPFGAEYSFDLGAGLSPARLEDTSGLFERPYAIRDRSALGGGIRYEQVSVAPGAGRSVGMWADAEVARGASATAPFTLRKSEEGEGRRWTVTNAGAVALRGVIVVVNGVYRLSDLPPGASVSFLAGDGPVAGEGVTAVIEEPLRPHARDYVSWEVQARLRAEWMPMGPWTEGGASGSAVAPRATPAAVMPPPLDPSARSPVRLFAFAEEADAGTEVTGLPERANRRGVVVYQVTLR